VLRPGDTDADGTTGPMRHDPLGQARSGRADEGGAPGSGHGLSQARPYHAVVVDGPRAPQAAPATLTAMDDFAPPSVGSTSDALALLRCLAEGGEAPPGCLLLVLTGPGARVELVVAVDEVPTSPPQHERVRLLAPFLRRLAREADGVAGVLLAVCREGPVDADGDDLAWHDAFTGASGVAGLVSHGVFVVAPAGVCPVRPSLPREVA
jgi:hypothetical protein